MFEIQFTDRVGNSVRRIVPSHALASQLAKDLAMASGKRAIVRRRPGTISQKWAAVFVDLQTGSLLRVSRNVSRSVVSHAWKNWDHIAENAVFVPWPEGADMPAWLSEKVVDHDRSDENYRQSIIG